ncbi:hypothetical protein PUR71_32990 [Streptomyces sp. SP17BM10]|uniref:hypothetical protein n=1 Tax=Streptomyces sp. SP17BM10 TaxID=3002530 RepID=UPI002E7705E4|nr:hypothetical protein [Streptomyces sp. SP17BM10]MEE1787690.1 hypothetical protein [Streptomyces sp. SP17BM10]
MGRIGRRTAAVVAAGVLVGVLGGCASGDKGAAKDAAGTASSGSSASAAASGAAGAAGARASGPAAGGAAGDAASAPAPGAATPPAGGADGSVPSPAAGGAGVGAPGADSDAVLLDDKLVLQVLPDVKTMAGWEEEKRRVDTADHATTCTAAAPCTGKPLSGSVRFSSGDVVARFMIDTLPTRDAAKDRLKETSASYRSGPFKAVDSAVLGSESQVFQGQLAGSEGVGIVLRSGTVVASVTTEGGPVDIAATRRFATMLVKRIEQAQAGRTPDAGLAAL